MSGPLRLIALLLILAVARPVWAAPVAQGIGLGSGRLYPSLSVEQRHESNYFRIPDSSRLDPLSTWITVLRPRLNYTLLKGQRAARAIRLTYDADIGTVQGSPNDNFVDQRANLSGNWEIDLTNRFRLEYEFMRSHDRRGSGDPSNVSRPNFDSHPDLWKSQRFEGGWTIGRPGRKTLVDLWVTSYARRYLNNDQEVRDNDRLTLNATLSRRLAPKSRAVVQLWWQNIDYINQPPGTLTKDSEELRLYSGVIWDVSPKTSINARGGWLVKDFRARQRDDLMELGWEAEVRWRPKLDRMVLDLSTSRVPRESNDSVASSVVISAVEANWLHYLTPKRHYYEIGAAYTNDDYEDTSRIDHRMHLSAGLYTQFRRRTVFGVSVEHQRRESDLPAARYDNNVVQFTLDVRL